ncbi:PHP domain-containing protein [Oceanobacter mangrovi]|uniref:PHP domain-containing protein n=1 Tax=Oceanobacter mangrovi TaxID=2862510 RepID=UPI001C8D4C55|nr:PHP domain-containing protein [Oceanobacter mangrovi]
MAEATESVHVSSDIDLHCHSNCSDGFFPPADVVRRAHERGITTLAITDHDTVEGFRQGLPVAEALGIRLISGIELSTVWSGVSIHIVGLGFDPQAEIMLQAEQHQQRVRAERAQLIASRVGKKLKVELDIEAIAAFSNIAIDQLGRPHFAAWMVEHQLVANTQQAFSKWLGAGKIGDVKSGWPEMATAVDWIKQSGGVAVMAHAHLYKMTRTKLRSCVRDFINAGGSGLEVSYGLMDSNQQGQMAALAREFNLLGSCGSDFHGPNRFGLELGVMPNFPKLVTPVWQQWG